MATATNHLSKENLEEILVRTKMLTTEEMQKVLQIAGTEGSTIEQVLIENKLLTPHDLVRVLSIQLKVPLIDLRRHKVSPEALSLVPEQLARKHNVLPLDIMGNSLTIVMEDTRDVRVIDDIATVSKMQIEPMMAVPDEIREAIDRNYTAADQIKQDIAV